MTLWTLERIRPIIARLAQGVPPRDVAREADISDAMIPYLRKRYKELSERERQGEGEKWRRGNNEDSR